MIDATRLEALAAHEHDLAPDECAALAREVAALVDLTALDRAGEGSFDLLWRNSHSEAWLNQWWALRDTGFHDHSGSCVGVHVLEGSARNEALVIGGERHIREYGAGDSFSFPGTGIHRMEHDRGAVTIHVYSPPITRSDTTTSSMASCAGSPDRRTRALRRAQVSRRHSPNRRGYTAEASSSA